MIMRWLKSIRSLVFMEKSSQDTLWIQRQMLKKKYQDKKQDQSYENQAKMLRSPVKIGLVKKVNSNLISFEPKKTDKPKNTEIRKIKEA
jgi:hypothetical protein